MKTLTEVQKFLNGIQDINRGGCGISALAIYKWLQKQGESMDRIKFIYLYKSYNEDIYLNNESVLRDNKGVARAPNHCCISYNGKFIDSKGDVDLTIFKWVQIIDEEDFIRDFLNNTKTWNSMFSRDCINNIEKELEIKMGDIKK